MIREYSLKMLTLIVTKRTGRPVLESERAEILLELGIAGEVAAEPDPWTYLRTCSSS